jgi:hypothetical protein
VVVGVLVVLEELALESVVAAVVDVVEELAVLLSVVEVELAACSSFFSPQPPSVSAANATVTPTRPPIRPFLIEISLSLR